MKQADCWTKVTKQAPAMQTIDRQQELTIAPSPSDTARWTAAIAQATRLLRSVQTEMQAFFDSRPIAWRDSEAGDEFRGYTDNLEEIISDLSDDEYTPYLPATASVRHAQRR